jgi:peptidoglycan/LPS O-acetylase OafA/YrhL
LKLREIERLRAIAAFMVVVTHTVPGDSFLGGLFGHPRTGVDLFFVISGFVVTRSLLRLLPELTDANDLGAAFDKSRRALRVFYVRRFFRIVPLAVAMVILQRVLFALALPSSDIGGDARGYWREVVAIFMGVYNYAMPVEGYNQFGTYWSLSVEEHFYLLLPLAFLLVRTRGGRLKLALAGIALVAFVIRGLFDTPPPGVANAEYYQIFTSHLRFDSLFAGVALSLALDGEPAKPFMPPAFMKWVVLPFCLALVWALPRAVAGSAYLHQGFTATWFLCAVLVGYASFDRGYVLEIPVLGRVLEYLGARSYAIYLIHIFLLRIDFAIKRYDPEFTRLATEFKWLHWGVYLLVLVAAAEISWRALEWPMQKLGRRLTDPTLPPWKPGWRQWAIAGSILAGALLLYFHHEVSRLVGPKNLALGRRVTVSSANAAQPDPQQLTNGILESERGLHTSKDGGPWAIIDLGASVPIGTIVTYNRADGWQTEVLPLTIEVSTDGSQYRPVGRRTTLFSQWIPWRLRLSGVEARYIRYRAPDDGYICLAETEVFAP